jgi:hypothetical protein
MMVEASRERFGLVSSLSPTSDCNEHDGPTMITLAHGARYFVAAQPGHTDIQQGDFW